jgi:DNA primase
VDSQINEIKNRLNVLDVVSGYVKLTKTGVNYRGVCPFHSEKGPSFFVSPARQMWHCFGCGAGGDVFEFIKKIEGIEFGDALRILAEKAGVELKRENPQLRTERQRLHEICELGCSFFEKQLESGEWGNKAKEYLLNRGIKEETIKKWRLGYSPDTWQSLSDFLVGKGYSRQEIVKAGLAVQSDKGGNPYDRFRGRIIFPIFDLNSQVIGFGARIFKEADKKETAKYINTPQTMLYDKSNVLYGINNAKLEIRKNNQCVLTEGYTDAIMCHQAGFENTVAVSGTALTANHLNILKRYTDNLLLSFDMDLAGSNATNRGIDLAISQEFNIKVIDTYSNAKDPAEIILENPANWENSVKNATPILDFYLNFAFKQFNKDEPHGRKQIQNFLFARVSMIQNKIEQAKIFQKMSRNFEVSEEIIFQEFKDWTKKNIKVENNYQPVQSTNIKINQNNFTSAGRKKMLEERIMSLILRNPSSFNLIKECNYCLFDKNIRKFLEEIKKVSTPILATEEVDMEEKLKSVFADFSKTDENKYFFETLALRGEIELENEGPEEIELCLLQIKDIKLRNELENLSLAIGNELDAEKREKLKEEFNKKAKELHFKAKNI